MQTSFRGWFCLRTQSKHEHIAAAHLIQDNDVEVYLPRIKFKRSTRQGPVWFTEALFPNYLFARFDFPGGVRKVQHTRGVSSVVHFGHQWPQIPAEVIDELRAKVNGEALHVIQDEPQPGEDVLISGGAFHNLNAVVSHILSARQRVAVLLDFLGRQTTLELPLAEVVRKTDARCGLS